LQYAALSLAKISEMQLLVRQGFRRVFNLTHQYYW
jgi:hypothetical protein